MRVVVIDPILQEVREQDITGSLKSLQSVVGGYIEMVPVAGYVPELGDHHVYCNEEGRLHGLATWHLQGWPESELAGPAIVLRSTRSGDEAPATVSVEAVRGLITWLGGSAKLPDPAFRIQVLDG